MTHIGTFNPLHFLFICIKGYRHHMKPIRKTFYRKQFFIADRLGFATVTYAVNPRDLLRYKVIIGHGPAVIYLSRNCTIVGRRILHPYHGAAILHTGAKTSDTRHIFLPGHSALRISILNIRQ